MQARHVLGAIGAGDRTNKALSTRAGLQAAPLARSRRAPKVSRSISWGSTSGPAPEE
jgi:hypothetical protein